MSGNPFEQAEQVKPRERSGIAPATAIAAGMIGAVLIRNAAEVWQTVSDIEALLNILYFLVLCAWVKRS